MHRKRLGRVAVAILAAEIALGGASALAANPWAGPNPPANYPAGRLPSACFSKPSGATCINAGVYYLDKARAKLHQPAYKLPANFTHLSPEEQVFILTNLDRSQYKLPAMTGLTQALGDDASSGVRGDADPRSTDPNFQQATANWAGGYPNIVLAYEAWMYNDGYHSPNLDCKTPSSSLCWGHRHDILWKFVDTGPAAMGAAAGKDSQGRTGFAILLGRGTSSYHPKYIYRWTQAVADGAGKHNYPVHKP